MQTTCLEVSHLLVVDDEPAQRSLIKGILRGLGYRVTAVASGLEALESIELEPPDAVILDIRMPVMSGYEVLSRLRCDDRFRRMPVVIVTDVDNVDDVGRCLGLGADDYLTKPFHPMILDARMNRVLGRQSAHNRDVLELVRKMDALRILADGVVHDFQNILAAIRYRAVAIQRTTAEARSAEMSGEILEADKMAKGIIEDLETFARGSTSPSSPVDLGAIVDNVVGQLGSMIPEGITLLRERDACGPYWIAGHASDLERIILNLVLNARNAMPSGGKLVISLEASGPTDLKAFKGRGSAAVDAAVKLKVRDEGRGIPSEMIPKIFDPYFKTGQGRGLGLAIVHRLVHGLGGLIDVRSRLSFGTTFTLQFPRLSSDGSEDQEMGGNPQHAG